MGKETDEDELEEGYKKHSERSKRLAEEMRSGRGAVTNLENALDGLIVALNYAEEIGEDDLSVKIGECYQELGTAAPDESFEELPDDRKAALSAQECASSESVCDNYYEEEPISLEELTELLAEATDSTVEEIQEEVDDMEFAPPEDAVVVEKEDTSELPDGLNSCTTEEMRSKLGLSSNNESESQSETSDGE